MSRLVVDYDSSHMFRTFTVNQNLGASLIQQDLIGYPYLLSTLRTRTVVHVDQL